MDSKQEEQYNKYLKGTTTLSFRCADGVILASDSRATMGFFIADKEARKIYPVNDNMAMTTAGLVADNQALVRLMKAQTMLYKLDGKPMQVKTAATLLANILNANKFYPYWVQLIFSGYDNSGGHVFELDAVGGISEKQVASTGSGSPTAYGVLETQYKENLSVEEGIELAVKSLYAAMQRDAASGNSIRVSTITKDGYVEIGKEKIQEILNTITTQ